MEDTAQDWYERGNELVRSGKFEESLSCYGKAIEIQPDNYDAWFARGEVLWYWGEKEEGFECLDKLTQMHPNKSEAWIEKAKMLLYLGRYEEAQESAKKAAEIDPQKDYLERVSEFPSNKNEHAEKYLNAGNSFLIQIQIMEGDCKTEDDEENLSDEGFGFYFSIITTLEYVRLDPVFIFQSEDIEYSKKQHALKALECFDRVIELQPDDFVADAWYHKGLAYICLKRHDEALESFNKAVQLQPDYIEAWNNRGLALTALGRFEEALESFNRVIGFESDDIDAWYNRGLVLDALGKHEEALGNYDRVTQLQPGMQKLGKSGLRL